ncbi:unnamed protein product, partial [Polarella glacialis]
AMPRGPGKSANYNLDYSRFNGVNDADVPKARRGAKVEDEEDQDQDAEENSREMSDMLRQMPPELQEAYRLMSIRLMTALTLSTLTENTGQLPAVRRKVLEAKLWSSEELALHDGRDKSKPLLMAVVGEVFDVGTGHQFYGPGAGGYSGFAGRDGGRALATGDFTPEGFTSSLVDLEEDEVYEVLRWRDFYRKHETYRFVGYLQGPYFGADGKATPELKTVKQQQASSAEREDLLNKLSLRFKGCNSKHVAADPFFKVWCSDGYHPTGSVPAHMYYLLPGKQEEQSMCVCVAPGEAREEAERESSELRQKPVTEDRVQACRLSGVRQDEPRVPETQGCDTPLSSQPRRHQQQQSGQQQQQPRRHQVQVRQASEQEAATEAGLSTWRRRQQQHQVRCQQQEQQ